MIAASMPDGPVILGETVRAADPSLPTPPRGLGRAVAAGVMACCLLLPARAMARTPQPAPAGPEAAPGDPSEPDSAETEPTEPATLVDDGPHGDVTDDDSAAEVRDSEAAPAGSDPERENPTPPTDEVTEPAPEPELELEPTAPPAVNTAESTSAGPIPDPEARHLRRHWAACAPNIDPCTRSRPARALLLGLGVAAGAAAAGLLFGLGDRLVQADPATLLAGLGGLAGAGALAGMVAGRLGADGTALPDRLRPPTASLAYDYAGPQVLDESRPHTMALRWAPNLFFPHEHGRLRLFGHFGGWLNPAREVDPRPQFTEVPEGQQGTSPSVLRQRHLALGVGLDLAVNLPYPVLTRRRSAHLGRAELRYRPQVEVRRDRFAPGTPDATIIERTIVLPLTVGVRWVLSERQRLTLMAGPRFDAIAFSDPGSTSLRRGGMQVGPLYGEAWYDIDIPLTGAAAKARRADATAQLNLGYIHARFDGRGFDFGPVIGFFGPIHVGMSTRIRPSGSPVAIQGGAFARIGGGTTLGLELGISAPDATLRGQRRRR